MTAVRKHLTPVADDAELPFTSGRWELAKGGRSVNLPKHGKLRQEASGIPDDERAGNMRLVQCAPAMWEMMLDYRAALLEPGELTAENKQELVDWITKLEVWVHTGDDAWDPPKKKRPVTIMVKP